MTSQRAAAALAAVFVVLGLLVGVRWSALTSLDRSADSDASAAVRGNGWLLSAARGLTHLGDPAVVTGGAVVVAVVLVLAGHRRAAAYLLLVRAVAAALGWLAKEAVRRHRPVLVHPVAHATGFSYPSGHALGGAAFYASLVVVAWRWLPRPVSVVIAVAIPMV